MARGLNALLFPTSDPARMKRLLSVVLGGEPAFDDAYYVGWQMGGLNIGLDPNGRTRGMAGATPFFDVEDIRATVDALKALGATLEEDVRPVGGGMLVAILSDQEGNMIGLSQSS